MERGRVIITNKIKCKLCGEVLESTNRHEFVPCKCFRESQGAKGCACDGGSDYLRRVGNPGDWEDLSETRPYTDEEVEDYNKRVIENSKHFGSWYTIDLMV